MNFQHSAEQRLLRESLAGALREGAPGAVRSTLAEFGAFGVLVAEERGGLGLGVTEAAIILEQAGRACLGLPLAETLALADGAALAFPDRAADILAGRALIAGPSAGRLASSGGRLHGALRAQDIAHAAWLAARLEGGGLVLLGARELSGAPVQPVQVGERAAELRVDVAEQGVPLLAVADAEARVAVLRCAELLGAASHCFDLSVAYMKDRSQFGQPIGANQALKHMAADAYLALENVRVAVEYAAACLDASRAAPDDTDLQGDASRAVQVMLAYVPRAARQIGEAAIQFHGSIGLTWEYQLNRYLRRIIRLGMLLGPVPAHQEALLDMVYPANLKGARHGV